VTGFAKSFSANQKPRYEMSSPCGEETGEGGRKKQITANTLKLPADFV
jgi:hypothetical protein